MASSSSNLDLSEREHEILIQFRQSLNDVLQSHHDDFYLLKWLKARNFNISKAQIMIRKSLLWRKEFEIDDLVEKFKPSEVLLNYIPGGTTGFDRNNRPIYLLTAKDLDLEGIFQSVTKTELQKFFLLKMEQFRQICVEESERLNVRIDQAVGIADLNGLTLKQFFVPGINQVYDILKLYEANYPEFLGAFYVVNAPRIFPIIFNVVKPIMSEDTKQKIHIYGRDWKEKIIGVHINEDQLPLGWGGTQIDRDGDEWCRSKVVYGSTVPRSFYLKDQGLLNQDKALKLKVKRGSVKKVGFEAQKDNSCLRYVFQTDHYDIGYGIFKANSPDDSIKDMTPLIKSKRVDCHLVPESGSISLRDSGLYFLAFDNSFSWTKGKTIYYEAEIIEPDTERTYDVENLEDVEEALGENGKNTLEADCFKGKEDDGSSDDEFENII
ncbi:DgyrCDS9283 [Dimorphilus gyrociliatus]|uniref:DgyrCDS9283 n=1 Tax=Dimorphilus gyrociliatus TaxID=2664684 RepID=A0A7I8VWW0_9ANNE|nr:DgyrCDS9283 [Dimorphilus gyrociliatus]